MVQGAELHYNGSTHPKGVIQWKRPHRAEKAVHKAKGRGDSEAPLGLLQGASNSNGFSGPECIQVGAVDGFEKTKIFRPRGRRVMPKQILKVTPVALEGRNQVITIASNKEAV